MTRGPAAVTVVEPDDEEAPVAEGLDEVVVPVAQRTSEALDQQQGRIAAVAVGLVEDLDVVVRSDRHAGHVSRS